MKLVDGAGTTVPQGETGELLGAVSSGSRSIGVCRKSLQRP